MGTFVRPRGLGLQKQKKQNRSRCLCVFVNGSAKVAEVEKVEMAFGGQGRRPGVFPLFRRQGVEGRASLPWKQNAESQVAIPSALKIRRQAKAASLLSPVFPMRNAHALSFVFELEE